MKTKRLASCILVLLCALLTAMTAMPHHHHGDTACMSRDVDTEAGHDGRRCTSFCSASLSFYRQAKEDAGQHTQASDNLCGTPWQPMQPAGDTDDGGKLSDGYAERMHPTHLKASKGLRSPPIAA